MQLKVSDYRVKKYQRNSPFHHTPHILLIDNNLYIKNIKSIFKIKFKNSFNIFLLSTDKKEVNKNTIKQAKSG